jgi:hypothetical protein
MGPSTSRTFIVAFVPVLAVFDDPPQAMSKAAPSTAKHETMPRIETMGSSFGYEMEKLLAERRSRKGHL